MFQKKSELTYITKSTTREELIDECRRLKNLVCQLRHVKKKHVKTKTYEYKFGDTSFYVKGYGNFVPYLEFKTEEERLLQVKTKRCQAPLFMANN